jgi:uncharacterized protein YlxP (DUF503 family)
MIVGIGRVRLMVPASQSLKEKRAVLRRIKDKVRTRFNVAVAEVADNELWQTAVLGYALVANERRFIEGLLTQVTDYIAELGEGRIMDDEHEIIEYDDGALDSSGEVSHWEPDEPSPVSSRPARFGARKGRPMIPVRRR